ncbi:hypothetical protein, partial [Flavobacterium sp.]|uniref:hypothetical protein n=1 Tax=Flavobacterium sp. TaxID=239 RepID=UPI0037BEFDF6
LYFILEKDNTFRPVNNRNNIIGQNIEVKLVFSTPVSYLRNRETGNKRPRTSSSQRSSHKE